MKIQLTHSFEQIISVDNLLLAWQEFVKDKSNSLDVQIFAANLADNIFALHNDLQNQTYIHGAYQRFTIADPKPRIIHKASVRDRLVHHAIHRVFYPFFNRTFISDSFSCRVNKGPYAAITRLKNRAYKVSKNNTVTCWVLKCDIKKFFNNIHHETLLIILADYMPERKTLELIEKVVYSFSSYEHDIGLPLGNLTSQLFSNIYMNVFDQFVKHKLKARQYIRYADDFVILSHDRSWLKAIIPLIQEFLKNRLKLTMHPDKIYLQTLAQGIDFLGWVHFPDHRVLRSATKRKMFCRMQENPKEEVLQSYLGLVGHGNTFRIQEELVNTYLLDKLALE